MLKRKGKKGTDMQKTEIVSVKGREVLDSRGRPTVMAEVVTADGSCGTACVPSGASTGKYEAYEMRDGQSRYGGHGVQKAVSHVNGEISKALVGMDATDQWRIDARLCELDGSEQKKRLGANAVLAVSLATARAASAHYGMPLWRYVGGGRCHRLPIPMMNVINGGAHAADPLDVQEFMILPVGAESFAEGLRMGAEIYHVLGNMLQNAGHTVSVGDEGGYAPALATAEEALQWLCEAIMKAGYDFDRVRIALDMAASEWHRGDHYLLPKSGVRLSTDELIGMLEKWCVDFPLFSVEDALGEDDREGWQHLTERLGERLLLVGDDLFVTNTARLKDGIRDRLGNAILIKPNQIGSLSETLQVIDLAQTSGYRHILSHRSGETEDSVIADLAVATGAPLIKAGAPCRSDRVAKYNRLLNVAEELGEGSLYGI